MIRNYLKVALRSLWRHRAFTAINVLGLGLGLAVCLLIALFIRDQRSYDAFHDGADRTYRIYSDLKASINPDNALYGGSPYRLAEVVRAELPGVEAATVLRSGLGGRVQGSGATLPVQGIYADPSFFDVFSFRLAAGDARTALAEPLGLVLSPQAARRFFGTRDPLGQPFAFEDGPTYTVTGVFADERPKTHLPLEAVASTASQMQTAEDRAWLDDWEASLRASFTYVRLAPGMDAEDFEARLPAVIARHFAPQEGNQLLGLHLQPLTRINLGQFLDTTLGMPLPAFVGYVLAALALVVMLVACLNYVGLTTARALTRAREVGVRKVVGAHRPQLVVQFLVEAFVVAGAALVVAALLLVWLVPAFNQLALVNTVNAGIALDLVGDAGLYGTGLAAMTLVALAAGLYPAFYLTRFQPAAALKGLAALRQTRGAMLQKGLAVTQFALALVLVVTTVFLYRQATYLLTLDYGFEQELVVNVPLQGAPYDVFRARALESPSVVSVAGTSMLPSVDGRQDVWVRTPGAEEPVKGYTYGVDEGFVPTLGLGVVAGRAFEAGRPADRQSVVLNERAVRDLGLGDARAAVGRPLVLGDSTPVEIIGVVADFQSSAAGEGITPVILEYAPERIQWASVRAHPGEAERATAHLAGVWSRLGQTEPFTGATYAVQLAEGPDKRVFRDVRNVVGFIAGLALAIACLGLLGLATYAAERRTKEVGIRKVLGATSGRIVVLLAREFAMLLVVAVALALPAAWALNGLWLDFFAQRVALGAGPFLVGAGLVLGLSLLTIGSQALRAAQSDPVEALRYE